MQYKPKVPQNPNVSYLILTFEHDSSRKWHMLNQVNLCCFSQPKCSSSNVSKKYFFKYF